MANKDLAAAPKFKPALPDETTHDGAWGIAQAHGAQMNANHIDNVTNMSRASDVKPDNRV